MGTRRNSPLLALVTGLAMVAGACSSSPATTSPTAAGPSGAATIAPSSEAPSQPTHTGLLKKIADTGEVKFITTNSVPWSFIPQSGGDVQGIAADVFRGFLASQGLTGIQLEPVVLPFQDSIPGLQAAKADMILDLFYITDERKKVIDFVSPFMMDPEALLVKAGNPLAIQTLADLCGKKVGVNQGTAYADLAVEESKKCPADQQMQIQYYPNYQGQLSDVGIGRIDATLIDAPVGAYALKENPSLGFELVPGYEATLGAPISVMFQKGVEGIKDEFNAYLKAIRTNGELAGILTKWGMTPIDLFLAPESDY